jgi:hypothetical protein
MGQDFGMTSDREYRETFSYKTEANLVDQTRANVENGAERFGLRLADFNATPDGKGNAAIEVTVVGKSADLTRMRENVIGGVSVFGSSAGTDLTDIVWDFTVGPVLDFAATTARRGWWAAKRRRHGENDDNAEKFPDIGL